MAKLIILLQEIVSGLQRWEHLLAEVVAQRSLPTRDPSSAGTIPEHRSHPVVGLRCDSSVADTLNRGIIDGLVPLQRGSTAPAARVPHSSAETR